jgi:hypothetical protein
MSHNSGNGSGSTPPPESQTPVIEPSGSGELADRKATGPRTEQGKQRSSRNATKHGLFSKVIVLSGESRAEYEELLTGLWETWQPKGTHEELLVEKLAVFEWRHRRMLLAESAAIRTNMEFVESELLNNRGLIGNIHDPGVLERCWELLFKLRRQIRENGFKPESDKPILETIYGERGEGLSYKDLYDSYRSWMAASEVPEGERVGEDYTSPEHCRIKFMRVIDDEICSLRDQQASAVVQTARTQPEIACHNTPDRLTLDLLLRYEAHLERCNDRTQSQLERLQRMRKGQPVLP